ncbi:MAG: DUF459 domain-containing protein [Chloroflexi bacterium]|nr:DUF459 domain-containing protein [Chloroflexota bacterium]
MAAAPPPSPSPTSPLSKVLLAIGIAFLLGILFDARSMVHAGQGMSDGPARIVTLDVGRAALAVAKVTHLTWPRHQLDALLGHQTAPSVSPLLALAAATPTAQVDPTSTIQPTATAVAVSTSTTSETSTAAQVASTASPSATPTMAPTATPAATATPVATPTPRGPPLFQPTKVHPLRLLVTGDSLTGYLGPELIDAAARVGPVLGFVDTHDGTGLTRPDFVDWSVVASEQGPKYHPDAVVVLIGGNDFQNMTLPGGKFFLAGTPAWTAEYARRVQVCMERWLAGGARRVYWLSMPPARRPDWAHDDAQINVAIQMAAARVPGAEYVNILGPITNDGKYTDFIKKPNGQVLLIREQDGVHLNQAGSQIAADEVLKVLERQWHFGPQPTPTPSSTGIATPTVH